MFPHKKRQERLSVWAFPAQIPDHKNQTIDQIRIMNRIDGYLQSSSIPKLLLFSEHDPVFILRQVRLSRKLVKSAKYHEIKDAGHFLQEDQPIKIAGHIQRWIDDLAIEIN
jgi:pimeloyl-ACP methyl ester carboxylesterase